MLVKLLIDIAFSDVSFHKGDEYPVIGGTESQPVIEDKGNKLQLFPHEYEFVKEETDENTATQGH